MKLGEDVSIEDVAKKLTGYSGADITNVCRDAAMQVCRLTNLLAKCITLRRNKCKPLNYIIDAFELTNRPLLLRA